MFMYHVYNKSISKEKHMPFRHPSTDGPTNRRGSLPKCWFGPRQAWPNLRHRAAW